uniref:uncharacterized protein LOC120338077 n=1 Tax=Styela clava TaxID=7725 RepID=UPI00193AD991|nr:uncharacterized protein LOC120338077 [Styela clava]
MGYAEEVYDSTESEGQIWYINHHGVHHPEKKKIRVVFDCSSKFQGICLNDVLLQGPDLANNLVGVLSRFRKNVVAVQGDIRSMFLQVKVPEKHRNYLRFFWWEDSDINKPMKEFRMTAYPFGTVCSPSCCNYALKQAAEDNKHDFDISVINAINDSFYVDDFFDSRPNAESAVSLVKNISAVCAKGGFEVLKMDQVNLIKEISEINQWYYVPSKLNPADVASRGKQIPKSSSLCNLQPFLENGLLRVGGRIRAANVEFNAKHPIIIPKESKIASLIIDYVHRTTGHNGREYVLAEINQKYWIVKGNALVRSVLRGCVPCRKRQRPPESQLMADLPENRLIPDKPPFTYVAVDCFGPFLIKQGRSEVKRYGVLFTCLVSRAVHVEIANSLDTSAFIMSLRRFIARRGQVIEMRSDNGTNFVSGERELRDAIKSWNKNQIHDYLLQKNIKWIFQTPASSHHGGVFERQIRTIRKIFNAICCEQVLTDESLRTLMCECENIVNGRPITTVSNDPKDLTPLSPNNLLLMKEEPMLPPGVFDPKDMYVRKRWKQVQYLADVFWKRWRKEFLPLLQCRQKWNKVQRDLQKDDIVLVVNENQPRNTWLLGRVIETYQDSKGRVRSVGVQTKHSIFQRPVTKLVLLRECDEA